ncbi:MAG: hypothetical protein COA44_14105 [Arcobacter sp.]|nr:MAG: hypothetical protein COA44_14105 [Arcobacter sp.]
MKRYVSSIALSAVLSSVLFAAPGDSADIEQLRQEMQALKQMVLELKKSNDSLRSSGTYTESEAVAPSSFLVQEVAEIKVSLEGNAKSGFQLAGYASFDWTDAQGENNDFSGVKFAPIFHYQYGDIFQFEGELEITTDDAGETNTVLEYAAGTLFLNDYMGLQVGKFMSPLGQFVQNIHPSWINKMPTAPLGFSHDGAAPTSNVGAALRGGLPKLGDLRSNYVFFVANAPSFEASHGAVGVVAEGKTTSNGVGKTFGGRFAVNPLGGMEIGVSLATGEVSEEIGGTTFKFDPSTGGSTSEPGTIAPASNASAGIIARDYDVFGVDAMYSFNSIDLKAEYIQQKVGSNSNSTLDGGTWKAWYAQASYQFTNIRLEPVLRYSNYISPSQSNFIETDERFAEQESSQWAIGLNYLFANNIIAKVAYEYNQDENNNQPNFDDNSVSAQLAFGF